MSTISASNRPDPDSADASREPSPDERDPRTVGAQDDSLLESIGKAIVAPVEGADEGAHRPGSVPPRDAPPAR